MGFFPVRVFGGGHWYHSHPFSGDWKVMKQLFASYYLGSNISHLLSLHIWFHQSGSLLFKTIIMNRHDTQVTQDTFTRIFWTSKMSKNVLDFSSSSAMCVCLYIFTRDEYDGFKFASNLLETERSVRRWHLLRSSVLWCRRLALCVKLRGCVCFVSSLLPTCVFFDGSPGIASILLEEFHDILQYHVFKCGLVALLIPCRFMIPVFWDLSSHKIPSHPATVHEVLEHDIRLVRQQVPKHLGKITIADTYGGARCPTSSGQKCITSTTCKASVGTLVDLWRWDNDFAVKWPQPKWIQTVLY